MGGTCEDWHLETGSGCKAKAHRVPGVLDLWPGGCSPQRGLVLLGGGRNSPGALPFSGLSVGTGFDATLPLPLVGQ